MKDETNTIDTNSQLVIRQTDNSPKDDDDFQLNQQFARMMTADEIQDKINELIGK